MKTLPDKKRISLIISATGFSLLWGAFVYWLVDSSYALPYVFAGALSAALFTAVCLRYVPQWVDFWWGEAAACGGYEPKKRRAAALFAGAMLFCVICLVLAWLLCLAMGRNYSFKESLNLWLRLDSKHYIDIARDWYLSTGHIDRLVQLAFYPLYPICIRLVALITGEYLYSAFIVSAVSFAFSCVLLYRLMLLDMPEEKAGRAVKLLFLLPGAFFFAAPMSESLFLLLSLACVYMIRRDKWFFGCMLGALAGFTRSLGLVLLVPAIFELFHVKPGGRAFIKRALCILIIPLGFAAYCLVNYSVSGNPFKFAEYLSGHWGQRIGWFFNTAAYQLEYAVRYFKAGDLGGMLGLWAANLLLCFLSLFVMLTGVKRIRASYSAYFLCYYIAAMGATWLLSAPRYLTVQLALPAALAAAADTRRNNRIITFVCILLSAAYFLAFVLGWQVW